MEFCKDLTTKYGGQSWKQAIDRFKKGQKEKPPDTPLDSITSGVEAIMVNSSPTRSTKLRKEDAAMFGVCPALDECYLTVCEECNAVIKPQALYSHRMARHQDDSDHSSVQHLLTQKPVIKGIGSKNKLKNSPRSSPKILTQPATSTTTEANILDKYQLPNIPPNGRTKTVSNHVNKTNSALAKHLSSASAQPIVALNDLADKNKSLKSVTINQQSSLVSTSTNGKAHKKLIAKRSLETTLGELAREPAKKLKVTPAVTAPSSASPGTDASVASPIYSPVVSEVILNQSTAPRLAVSQPSTLSSRRIKPIPVVEDSRITTRDKHIPCKDREYDPDRHCGCWAEEWGKHCTRSLTCKTHALSMRRKVPGRSKPFDQLLQEHRDAKEAAQLAKAMGNGVVPALPRKKSTSRPSSVASSVHSPDPVQFAKVHHINRPVKSSSVSAVTLFPDVDIDGQTDSDRLFDSGFSSFHPRPLAVPSSYGALLNGCSFLPNRKLDFLRASVKAAIESPNPKRKVCSASQSGPSASLAQLQKAQPAKSQTVPSNWAASPSKKKKSKPKSAESQSTDGGVMESVTEQSTTVPESLSRLSASPSALRTTQHGESSASVAQQLPSPAMVMSKVQNGKTNSMLLSDLASKAKVARGGLQLAPNSKHTGNLTVLGGMPYLYTQQASEGSPPSGHTVLVKNSDLLQGMNASNGVIYATHSSLSDKNSCQTALLGVLPSQSIGQNSNLQYVKPLDSTQGSQPVQNIQHFTLASRQGLTPQMLTMQLQKNAKPAVSRTLVTQSTLTQPQALRKTTANVSAPTNFT